MGMCKGLVIWGGPCWQWAMCSSGFEGRISWKAYGLAVGQFLCVFLSWKAELWGDGGRPCVEGNEQDGFDHGV
jgi:hypothetical protein